jgi:hypothetical protein
VGRAKKKTTKTLLHVSGNIVLAIEFGCLHGQLLICFFLNPNWGKEQFPRKNDETY